MRVLLAIVSILAISPGAAAASPPLDLFEEGSPRVELPSASWVGASDGPNLGLAGVGDVNGDGLGDLAMGNPGETATPTGAVHVLLGRASLRSAPQIDMADAGFTITGPANHRLGERVAAAGDVNGDGFGDILIANVFNPSVEADRGSAYVVFGSAAPQDVDLNQLGNRGFAVANTGQHERVAGLGDVDGDGYDDIAVGSGLPNVAVVYGGPDPQSLDALKLGERGFRVTPGERYAYVGQVAGAGDVNGDGHADLLAGLPASTAMEFPSPEDLKGGAVVFGGPRRTEPIDVSDLSGNGFLLELGTGAYLPGQSVAGLGDFNGDGLDDVALASPGKGPYFSGQVPNPPPPAVYVVFGSQSGAKVELEDMGDRGLRLLAGSMGIHGVQVSRAGDVNGDGRSDVVVGVGGKDFRQNDRAGRAFLAYGGPATGTVVLGALGGPGDSTAGFAMDGLPHDRAGHRVAGAGDMDGDSRPDLAVLAFGCQGSVADESMALGQPRETAELYVIDALSRMRGGGFSTEGDDTLVVSGDEPRRRGRGGDDALTGNALANCLYGDSGRDTLTGQDADDVLYGGADDDELTGGAGFDFLHGGLGTDVLAGGPDPDHLSGGHNEDTLDGGDGPDWVYGRPGDDALGGGAGEDWVLGGLGRDTLNGGDGDDHVTGGKGDDVLRGGSGPDMIWGAAGDDEIDAADGAPDRVHCGGGKDSVRLDRDDVITDRRRTHGCERVTRV